MAKMHGFDRRMYPNIGEFVRNQLPMLPARRGPAWSAFVRHCSLPDARAREAVQWSRGPQLRFTANYLLGNLVARFVAGQNPRSAAIWIKAGAARTIENDWERWEARIRMEALILHEMTHWGDWLQDGVLSVNETGDAFERDAYNGFQPVRLDYRLVEYPTSLRERAPPRPSRQ